MVGYLKRHEARMRRILEAPGEGVDWSRLALYHRRRIGDLQHERLVHLLVMLFVALFTLVSFLAFVSQPQLGMGLLVLLFLCLLLPYIAHYFRLENGVQRLYLLADELEGRAGEAPEKEGARLD